MRQTDRGVIVKNKKVLWGFLCVLVLSILSVQCYRPASEAEPVEVGQTAPDFKLQDLNGKEVSLEQYRGKIVILDFWQTTCPPCRISMPVLDKLEDDYSGKLSVLAVNLGDQKEIVREYILEQNLHSRVLLDSDHAVGERFGTVYIPTQYLIDQSGVVRYVSAGFNPATSPKTLRDEINKLL
jgi:peroxiredoxin